MAWELYTDLQSPLLPPPRKSLTYRKRYVFNELLLSFRKQVDLDLSRINEFDLVNLTPADRRLRIEGMREYLLMQFGYTRSRSIYNIGGTGLHLGTFAMGLSLTLEDVATRLLEALEAKRQYDAAMGELSLRKSP